MVYWQWAAEMDALEAIYEAHEAEKSADAL